MDRYILSLVIVFSLTASTLAQQAPPAVDSPFGNKLVAKNPDTLPAHALHRLGAPRMCQPGGVASIAVSPDGKWMATGNRAMANQVYVWDLRTGTPKWILQGHVRWIARLEFSADSAYVLASHHADTLFNSSPAEMVVWKVQTGEVVKYHQPNDWSLARDGKTLATGRPNLDPKNRTLAIRYKGFTVDLFDFPSHKLRRSITHPTKLVHSVALAPDGSMLAVGTANEILLYDTATGKSLPGIQPLMDRVHLLRFSLDGKMIASVSDNLIPPAGEPRLVELWDVKTGKQIATLTSTQRQQFRHLEFVPGGFLLTKHLLGEYQLWNLETRKLSRTFKVVALTLFREGQAVARNYNPNYAWTGYIRFEELATGDPLPIRGSGAPLLPWKFSDDGKLVFTRTRENPDQAELIQAWEVATGKEIADQRRHDNIPQPQTLMQKPNHDLGGGREIQYQWIERTFSIVDTKTAKELYHHKVTGFPAWSVSPDNKRLAVYENSFDRRIRIIDLTTFKELASIPLSVSQSVREYLFTPDGSGLAITEYQGKLRLYHAATGKLRLERGPVGQVVFAPDGRMVAVSNLVGTVDLIDLKD